MPLPTVAQLRAASFQTFGPKTSLQAAIDRMGFIQADPIRAPARAQDLTLMQRVTGYRAGDLERLYPLLDAEEDMIPNYGFVSRAVHALLHPREPQVSRIEREHPEILNEVRAFLQERGEVHPKEVAALLGRGRVSNAWGGQSSATTRALNALHYRGEVRVTRREKGIRLYALRQSPYPPTPLTEETRLRGVVHLLAQLYGPLPEASLGYLISLSANFGLPHFKKELRAAYKRAVKEELHSAEVAGLRYVWPADWALGDYAAPRGIKIVGPFDPLVWDRRRFTHLHGWTYRFEAYTPLAKRQLGYYALPLFQGEQAIGWANLSAGPPLQADFGFITGIRQTAALKRSLETELDRYRQFLNVPSG